MLMDQLLKYHFFALSGFLFHRYSQYQISHVPVPAILFAYFAAWPIRPSVRLYLFQFQAAAFASLRYGLFSLDVSLLPTTLSPQHGHILPSSIPGSHRTSSSLPQTRPSMSQS